MPVYAGLHLGIEIAAIQVRSCNPIPIFGQTSRGEGCAGPYLEAIGCGELIFRDAVVSRYLNTVDDGLRTFLNFEPDVNLRLVINYLWINLDRFVSPVLAERLKMIWDLVLALAAGKGKE